MAPTVKNTGDVTGSCPPPGWAVTPGEWRDARKQERRPETSRCCLQAAAESLGALGRALLLSGPRFSVFVLCLVKIKVPL